MVMFGRSYRFKTILRASEAHDSPRKKAGCELTFGCVENRAETAHTARMTTGGSVLALNLSDIGYTYMLSLQGRNILQLSHVAWFVKNMVCLAI